MTKEQFDRQLSYNSVMALARVMRSNNIVNDRDYNIIDKHFSKKYRPLICPLPTIYLTRRAKNLDYNV